MKKQIQVLLYLLIIIVGLLLAAITFLASAVICAGILTLLIIGLIPGGLFLLCVGAVVLAGRAIETTGKGKSSSPNS